MSLGFEMADPESLLAEHDTFVLDCDGVVWHGSELIPGVAEAIQGMREAGKQILFVTNSSARSRNGLMEKLNAMGVVGGQENEMVTAASAVALHLTTANPEVKKCYLIGSAAVKEELETAGIECLGGGVGADGAGEPQCVGEPMTEDAFMQLDLAADGVQAVVLAGDFCMSYAQICRASLYLQKQPGIPFILASNDAFDQLSDRKLPGPSNIGAYAIEMTSGIKPIVTGKPSKSLGEHLTRLHGLNAARTCMVGDRLDSDMVFGKSAGFNTLLVMTGCTTEELLQEKVDEAGRIPSDELWWPTFRLQSLGDLS